MTNQYVITGIFEDGQQLVTTFSKSKRGCIAAKTTFERLIGRFFGPGEPIRYDWYNSMRIAGVCGPRKGDMCITLTESRVCL